MTHQQRVEAFIDCWNRMDLDAACAAFSEEAVYHNIPMEPVAGKAQITAGIKGFMANVTACEWTTHHIAAAGNVVLTERTDRFTLADGRVASVRVMGTFELSEEGKITHWRDYFDSAEMAREFGMTVPEASAGEA